MRFFRFPHTPHLEWLGEGTPRDDKVLALQEAEALLANGVAVEEKTDGANVGFSVSSDGDLRVQNRGQYLISPYIGQFAKLDGWLQSRTDILFDILGSDLILFGEWCAARHSIFYDRLPDWLLVFDVYDRNTGKFYNIERRNRLAEEIGLYTVPLLTAGRFSLAKLKDIASHQSSHYRNGPVEGIVVRRDEGPWLSARAKLVNPEFIQNINTHWRKRSIEWNRLDAASVSRAG